MKTICPNCSTELEGDANLIGEVVTCPECGNDFIVARPTKLKAKRLKTSNMIADYAIGVLFGFLGVAIASMTDGKQGAGYASRGCVIHVAIIVGLYLVIST